MNNMPPSLYSDQHLPSQPNYPPAHSDYLGSSQPGYIPTQPVRSPGVFTYLQTPASIKVRVGIWIIAAILLAFLISSGVYYFETRSTPQKTLQAYCTDFKNGDASGLYNLLSTRGRQNTTFDQVQGFVNLSKLLGGIKVCVVVSVQEDDDSAIGIISFTFNNENTIHKTKLFLVNENDTWKFDSSAAAYVPIHEGSMARNTSQILGSCSPVANTVDFWETDSFQKWASIPIPESQKESKCEPQVPLTISPVFQMMRLTPLALSCL